MGRTSTDVAAVLILAKIFYKNNKLYIQNNLLMTHTLGTSNTSPVFQQKSMPNSAFLSNQSQEMKLSMIIILVL